MSPVWPLRVWISRPSTVSTSRTTVAPKTAKAWPPGERLGVHPLVMVRSSSRRVRSTTSRRRDESARAPSAPRSARTRTHAARIFIDLIDYTLPEGPTMPLLSILMPVFNAAETLPAALRSIAAQTLGDWELVAVNDGSGEASLEILARAARKAGRIRVLSGAHAGLVAALRSGARLASAPLLARMDADDVMHPRRLQLQAARLQERPRVDVLAT